jgi:GDSL-like Lipase/Acylhydrolase family
LLHAGTNDLAFGDDVGSAPQRLSALIDQIRAARPDAEIFVQRIVGSRKPWLQARIDVYNAAIPAIVAARDDRVHLVDQASIRGVMLFDMVHPGDLGYSRMAYSLYTAMAQVYGSAVMPWPAAVSPYRITGARLCHWMAPAAGTTVPRSECRWWQSRAVTTRVAGRATTAWVWQTLRLVSESFKVRKGKRTVRKTRQVSKWVSFDPANVRM